MINATKIDIIKNDVFCYNEENGEREIYNLTGFDNFINEFSDTQDLLTVNVSNPKARIVKFYSITESIPERFDIINYSDMTTEQKQLFDSFINLVETQNN